jgi:hypothetical protein
VKLILRLIEQPEQPGQTEANEAPQLVLHFIVGENGELIVNDDELRRRVSIFFSP